MGKINQIKVNNVDYDIEASYLVDQQNINVKTTSGSSTAVNFEVPSTKAEAVQGKVSGTIQLNNKGNLSVESLNKHVNIEAAKGIQMKPTTNIIIDTSRRVAAEQGNEAHIEVRWDDIPSGSTEDEYGKFIVEARAHDIRCYEHGGIALQPCGQDSSNFENKIKFESSRTNAIGSATPTYGEEGGKGLEFATFNNDHTSIYSGDYRFKRDAKIYCVNRDTIATVSGKTDYPTQLDDFKDIPVDDKGNNCTYNNTTKQWEISSTSTEATTIMYATWEDIIKAIVWMKANNFGPWQQTA